MSLTNAISAIRRGRLDPAPPAAVIPAFILILGTVAVTASMINVVGGYLITTAGAHVLKTRA